MQNNFPAITLAVAQFVHILRQLGVRVSIAETMDVYEALTHVDLLDKRQVKGALRALLVKNPYDWLIFNQAFEFFFLPGEVKQECLDAYRRQKEAEEEGLKATAAELSQLFRPWQEYIPEKYQLTRENIKTFARLPEQEQKRLQEIVAQMRGNPVNNPGELIARVVQAALNYWRYYLLKRQAQSGGTLLPEGRLVAGAHFCRNPEEQLLHEDMQNIKDENLPKITALIQQLSSRLASRLSRRYQKSRRARIIDIRRTIRQNIRYGGAPLELRYRSRRPRHPKIVLICDVSASMARYARFVLQFIYGLSSAGQKVESFIFSEDLERITPFFRRRQGFAETMTTLINGSRQWGQTTNFYAALQTFLRNYRKLIEPGAIFLVVSDTKTVSWAEAAGLLAEISRKVRDVVWLNPVPVSGWASLPALSAFQKSARMYECYTLFHLEKIFRKKIAG
ncbi:MAG: VWA domain-containing protein [Bacillota bacterium]